MSLGSGAAEARQSKPIVLVVDDTPAEIQVLGHMLLAHDYDVRFALNGAEALAAVGNESPDVIMLDIQMPGLNGYEVCRKIKSNEATADIPIIFISALDQALDKVQAFEAGAGARAARMAHHPPAKRDGGGKPKAERAGATEGHVCRHAGARFALAPGGHSHHAADLALGEGIRLQGGRVAG